MEAIKLGSTAVGVRTAEGVVLAARVSLAAARAPRFGARPFPAARWRSAARLLCMLLPALSALPAPFRWERWERGSGARL